MSEQRIVIVASGGTIPQAASVSVSGSAVSVSGNVVAISGGISVSGSTVITQIASGFNQVYTGGSGLFALGNASGIGMGTGSSGGNILASCGPIINVTLRSYSGNGPMFIGGVGVGNAAASGVGIELFNQEVLTLHVTNTNQISVFNEAGFSGQAISVITTAGYY